MASRFDYTAPPAALQFDLGVVTEVIDPLFFALDARYRETFGLELAVAQVEEFHKLGKLSPSELAREVALYGDPLTPGCIPQEGSLAGLWRLPDLQDEFDTIFREEIEKIIANENFQTADRQFVACTSTTQYPFPTLLRPPDAVFAEMYQMLVDTSPLVEAGTLTFDGVVDLSSDINEGMYATYQDCLASVSGLLDPAWCPHCVHSDGFI